MLRKKKINFINNLWAACVVICSKGNRASILHRIGNERKKKGSLLAGFTLNLFRCFIEQIQREMAHCANSKRLSWEWEKEGTERNGLTEDRPRQENSLSLSLSLLHPLSLFLSLSPYLCPTLSLSLLLSRSLSLPSSLSHSNSLSLQPSQSLTHIHTLTNTRKHIYFLEKSQSFHKENKHCNYWKE